MMYFEVNNMNVVIYLISSKTHSYVMAEFLVKD